VRNLPLGALGLASILAALPIAAQSSPSGREFRVNTGTFGDQAMPDVAMNPVDGHFLVFWRDADVCTWQRYNASGFPTGGAFTLPWICNGTGTGAASTAAGAFVVSGLSTLGSVGVVYGAIVDSAGDYDPFMVNTYGTGVKSGVRISSTASGAFVVVWSGALGDGNGSGVFGRRLLSNGVGLGAEFRLNSLTSGDQTAPAVALDGTGNFVTVWQSGPLGGSACCAQIEAQRYDSSGAMIGGEFRVNTYSGLGNYTPDVASDASGNFVIVWSDLPYGYSSEVLARRFSSSGAPLGDPFVVNGSTTIGATHPRVTRRNGDFVVVWQEPGDGSGLAVAGRRFAPDGSALGGIFRVNTFSTSDQKVAAIASKPDGGFVVVWESKGQDGSGYGIYGQKYCLGGDADGSGTVDVADVFYLINYLFAGGPAPVGCADADGNLTLDVADVFYLINYLFASGPPPV
jgi:hypothetical protein